MSPGASAKCRLSRTSKKVEETQKVYIIVRRVTKRALLNALALDHMC